VFLQLSKLLVSSAPAMEVVQHAMGRPAVAPVAVLLEQGSIDRSVIRGGHGPCSWDRRTRRRTSSAMVLLAPFDHLICSSPYFTLFLYMCVYVCSAYEQKLCVVSASSRSDVSCKWC
jgi:hypothetical protein